MHANSQGQPSRAGRWIRPARAESRQAPTRMPGGLSLDDLAGQLLRETRCRVSTLVALERQLEDKIRFRWEETENEVRRKVLRTEEDLAAARKRLEGEVKDLKVRAEKEGRAGGFREGFSRGREEGYRLGLEEGRRDGLSEGERQAREDIAHRLEKEIAGAASALAVAATELEARRESLLAEARRDLLSLARIIAEKIIKKELCESGPVAVRAVEEAVELIFRRGALTIQVHPDDAPAAEKALRAEPRWADGFDSIEVRPLPDVSRGGCRLVSGAGTVDMTVETQMALLDAALESGDQGPLHVVGTGSVAVDRACADIGENSEPQTLVVDGGSLRAGLESSGGLVRHEHGLPGRPARAEDAHP